MSTYQCTLPRKLYNLLCLFIDLGAFFFSKMSFKKTSNTLIYLNLEIICLVCRPFLKSFRTCPWRSQWISSIETYCEFWKMEEISFFYITNGNLRNRDVKEIQEAVESGMSHSDCLLVPNTWTEWCLIMWPLSMWQDAKMKRLTGSEVKECYKISEDEWRSIEFVSLCLSSSAGCLVWARLLADSFWCLCTPLD